MFVADHTNLVYCLFCPILLTYSSHHWKEKHNNSIGKRNCTVSRATDWATKTYNSDIFPSPPPTPPPSHWKQDKLYWKNINILALSSLFLYTIHSIYKIALVAKISISFRFHHLTYIYKSLFGVLYFPPFPSGKKRVRCGNHTFFWTKKKIN